MNKSGKMNVAEKAKEQTKLKKSPMDSPGKNQEKKEKTKTPKLIHPQSLQAQMR